MAACGASLNMNGNEPCYECQPQAINGGNPMGYGYAATQGSTQAMGYGYAATQGSTQTGTAGYTGYGGSTGGYTGYQNAPVGPSTSDDDDCVQVIRTVKRVVVPCKRKVIKNVTVQVPKTVMDKIPKQMPYTDVEKRVRSVPYVTQREEVRYTTTNQSYSTLVPKVQTKMVPVTRRVPKTVWVNETTAVPQQETVMVPTIRNRNIRIPYKVQIPQTKYRNETYHVPVTKYKTVYQDVPKTIYEPRTKQQCTTVTKMVSKDIPVYSAIPRAQGSCPPQPMVQPMVSDFGRDSAAAYTNRNGALNLHQYDYGRGAGLSVASTTAIPSVSNNTGYPPARSQIAQSGPVRAARDNYPHNLDGPETPTPVY